MADPNSGPGISKADWPHALKCNPHYLDIRQEANAWFLSYRPFASAEMNAYFVESDVPYLSAVCLPGASRERLRDCCDFMALFIYRDDEFDDTGGAIRDGMISTALSALEGHAVDGGAWSSPLREVWNRLSSRMPAGQQARLRDAAADYLAGCRQMTAGSALACSDLETYLAVRRSSIGERIDLVLTEYGLGIDLSPRDLARPLLQEVHRAHLDTVIAIQDLLSYRKEQRDGTAENLVTYLSGLHDCPASEAIAVTRTLLRTAAAAFDGACQQMHSTAWGRTPELAAYAEGLRDFTSGVAAWTAHSVRYTQPRPEQPARRP